MTDKMQGEEKITPVEIVKAEETMSCPYCGESIRRNARKCRYCGEWLAEGIINSNQAGGAVVPAASEVPAQAPAPVQPPAQAPAAAVAPGSAAAGAATNVVVNVQNIVQQKQEQTAVVEQRGGDSSSSHAWILGEMWLIAGGVGLAMKSWLWFFGLGIGLSVMLFIPFLGALLCWVAGIAWGLLAGAICAAIWSTGVGWTVGIIVAIGAIYGHLEARQKNIDEDD